ncbi:hypothetical protein FBZ84_101213 [Azospirillum baldaniorum]|uniref:hypothetical protein n=1 Tax=Azospirillum baldaniorum TaxID=1064539 RepID=UPI0011A08B94|nr:hypothetical protein [Azospirillum baldaniorum]TWA71946.1 hypothetical protein FBZ84_101213 [Azospirillum baldaniorum]
MTEPASFWDTPVTYGQVVAFYVAWTFLDTVKAAFGMESAAVAALVGFVAVMQLERCDSRASSGAPDSKGDE